jgi:asparagine synthase (glutamine-hydrolysing)
VCGIAGFSGSFDRALLARVNQCQSHRGPDDSGEHYDAEAQVGLSFVRLAILDLSPTGHQPMMSDDGGITLVFNGEIYNFRELKAELAAAGREFRGTSDTEVVLNLYQTHGAEMLSLLNGIFSIALWDKPAGTLLIARDALGVKPLYYSGGRNGVAFASEIKALLKMVPEARELDIPSLHRYLSFLYTPGEATPLREVKKLLPGHAMTVRDGRITRRWKWYDLPVFAERKARLSTSDAIAGTVTHLRQAVQRQLVADVPVGSFLSGGLDSSAVVAMAREVVPDIRCFTIETTGTTEPGITDDLPYAKRVAKHLHVPLDVVTIDANGMAADLEKMVRQLDEPLADPAPLNVLYISRLARSHGIKVLLSGAGGDDLFTGYRRHVALQYERYWRWLPSKIRFGIERATEKLNQQNPVLRRLGKIFSGAGLEGDASIANYFLWAKEAELLKLYTPEFRAKLGEAKATAPMVEFLGSVPPDTPRLERMLALEQRFFLADHNLNYTDKMSMAAGVEVRVPFLDLDLVEFAAGIAAGAKLHGRTGKWVLKKAMEPYLPKDVIYRPKSGFGAPLRGWMKGELRPLLHDLLSPESLRRRGLFDPAAVATLIRRNESGEVDGAYILLSLLTIEIWCREYLDRREDAA